MIDHGHLIFECGTVELTMVNHGQPWFNHGQNIARPWSTMVDHGSAMFILQRCVDLNVCTSGI